MRTRRWTIGFACSALVLAGCAAALPDRGDLRVRVVRVKVVADPALRRADAGWRHTARELLRAASDYYEREFNIRLALEAAEAWRVQGTTTSSVVLMRRLKSAYPRAGGDRPYDVVIGLTQQPLNFYRGGRARADRFGNCTEGLGNYIVSHVGEDFTYDDGELNHDAAAIIHEMGHLFGAVHTNDRTSIMHADFALRTGFDAPNRAIVTGNRLCPFAGGVSGRAGGKPVTERTP
ncbi:MAG: M12 family metallo-peptidase [Deltaproteobacteria bacterium]|nr:M12 family metallo-peptidase [Deltaproteobacteria bacterium]